MCLAIPSKIIETDGFSAVAEAYGGVRKEISLLLLPEEAGVGDFVLVHAGFAIQKVDNEGAQESYRFIETLLKEQRSA